MRKLPDIELESIKRLRCPAAKDLLTDVAVILNGFVGDTFKYSRNVKCVYIDDGLKVFITTKKDKDTGLLFITELEIFGHKLSEWDSYTIQ